MFVKNSYICIGLNKIRYEETDIDAHSVEFSRTYGNGRSASEEAKSSKEGEYGYDRLPTMGRCSDS